MLTSILQVLAEDLAGGITSLTSTDQIDFSHPARISDQSRNCLLSIYLYDIRKSKRMGRAASRQVEHHFTGEKQGKATVSSSPSWFDISIVITAIDCNATFEENQLFDEAFSFFLQHKFLPQERLPPELQGHGNLSMNIFQDPPIEIGGLWSALSVPVRPTIHLTVTVPINLGKKEEPYLVTQRVSGIQNSWTQATKGESVKTRRVSIVGIIKSCKTRQPIFEVKVALIGSKKSVTSDSEGLFFFDNLRDGNYKLGLSCLGYQSQDCNMLVENGSYIFKEILLTPV